MKREHDGCDPHEIFVGNTRRDGDMIQYLKSKGLRTIRLGMVAYDIDGNQLKDIEGYAPVFINRSESDLHNAAMMERTFGPNWRRNS